MEHTFEARTLQTKRELSLKQRLEYLEFGLRVEVGLEEAIRLLSMRESGESNPEHLERLCHSLRHLDGAWLTVHADMISFLSGDLKVAPPDKGMCRRVGERTTLLSQLLPDALPSVVLTLAGDIIDQWSSTRTDSNPDGEGSSQAGWGERLNRTERSPIAGQSNVGGREPARAPARGSINRVEEGRTRGHH